MYIETCVQGPSLRQDQPQNSEAVYSKFVEFLQYKLQGEVEAERQEKEEEDKKEEQEDRRVKMMKGQGAGRTGSASIYTGEGDEEAKRELQQQLHQQQQQQHQGEERDKEEKSVPLFTPGVCGGTQIRGNNKYSLIDIASLSFNYNHQAVPSTLNSDFLWSTAETLMQTSALSGRAEKTGFIQAGDGKGFFRHLLGDLGFSSLVVTKSPDASSNTLFQLASQTNDSYNCLGII